MGLQPIRIMAPQLPSRSDYSEYLGQIEENQIYSNFGPLVKKLEFELSKYLGVDSKLVVSCANATLGLEGLFCTSLVPSNEIWETPSWTFAATNLAAIRSGVRIKFVDINDDGRIIPSEKCKNLIDVLPFGEAPDFSRIPSSTQVIIIDAAASFDAVRNFSFPVEQKIAVVVSMHATKLMPAAGEGGFVFSNDAAWMYRFRKWSNFGFNSNRESEIVGTNAKMSEYSAAVGLASLANWNSDRVKWSEVISVARGLTEKYGFQVQSSITHGFVSPYWIIDTRDSNTTSRLEKSCEESLIETRRWWQHGNHLMAAFNGVPRDDLSNTERISSNLLALPLHLGLTLNDFQRIEGAFERIKNL